MTDIFFREQSEGPYTEIMILLHPTGFFQEKASNLELMIISVFVKFDFVTAMNSVCESKNMANGYKARKNA